MAKPVAPASLPRPGKAGAADAADAADGVGMGGEPRPSHCLRHPSRETLVSCGRCGRPFCPECLIHTPAGQRCYECAGVRRYGAGRTATAAVCKTVAVAAIGAAVGGLLGSLLFVLMAGLITGTVVGQVVAPAITRQTRRLVYAAGSLALVAGALLGWTAPLLVRLSGRSVPLTFFLAVALSTLLQNWAFWIFVAVAAAVAYQRTR